MVWEVLLVVLAVQEVVLGPSESVAEVSSTWQSTTRGGRGGRVQGVVWGLPGLERVCR